MKTEYDSHGTRYQLAKTTKGSINWLFLPGGAGADSCYFLPLIEQLKIPGNIWLIDFPKNGSNTDKLHADYDFESWKECLLTTVRRFENPVLVGHSFGGIYPLFFPEIEGLLKGLITICAAPTVDVIMEEHMHKERGITFDNAPGKRFSDNPSDKTFKEALVARSKNFFPPISLERGKKLFAETIFNYKAMQWWIKNYLTKKDFDIIWVPKKLPMLMIAASEDCSNPPKLIMDDKRFNRPNIERCLLKGSGHFPWLENMDSVVERMNAFEERVIL